MTSYRTLLMTLTTAAVLGAIVASVTAAPPLSESKNKKLTAVMQPGGKPIVPPIELPRRPDPVADAIVFQVVKRQDFRADVLISGVVVNRGLGHFRTDASQASVCLYEGNKVVAKTALKELLAGQKIVLEYRRSWDASSPAEGEFPPMYTLKIVYDPDFAIDGNRHNDDANLKNNTTNRSGVEINEMLR